MEEVERELIAGAMGGFVQDIIMHPADTVRARLQVVRTDLSSSVAAYRHVVQRTISREGVRGFYGGFSTVFMFSMPANAVYFTSYSVLKREYTAARERNNLPISDGALYFLAGFSAEICASGLWTPFDVVKQRLQVRDARSSTVGGIETTRAIVKEEGFRGLYRGLVAGWAVWGPFSAVYFCVYESLRPFFLNAFGCDGHSSADQLFPVDLVCGMCAGTVGAAATQPLDALKTRLQVGKLYSFGDDVPAAASTALSDSSEALPRSVFTVLRTMVREEGIVPLFRGVWGRVLWVAPGTGITVAVFRFVDSILTSRSRLQ